MAVGPGCVHSAGSASGIEQRRLREQHKGMFRITLLIRGTLRGSDFFQRPAEVYGCRPGALFGPPRNGFPQGPVHFANSRAILVLLQQLAKRAAQFALCKQQELARRDIAEGQVVAADLAQRMDRSSGYNAASERLEESNECVGYALRSALRNGPANRMAGCAKNHAERGA